MNKNSFVIKGDVCWSKDSCSLYSFNDAYLVCNNGKSAGVYQKLPSEYSALPCFDYSGKLVIPGLVDLHTHAPQFAFRGCGMDKELLEWLETQAFPEEAHYSDIEYAKNAYSNYVGSLTKSASTRFVIFATIHSKATLLLMDLLEASGLVTMVGKVNMDRNAPPNLCEESAESALLETELWLKESAKKNYRATKPILTPRFIPCCSDNLMKGLAYLQKKYNVALQSHLNENKKEIAWVKELCPLSASYTAAYKDFGVLDDAAVMAHCVWPDADEISILKDTAVFAAHCPESNSNLSSGIAPMRRLLNAGVNCGLGSDIAAGARLSIFNAMSEAIKVSKLRAVLCGESDAALHLEEVFYMGTKGGGAFFGSCGSFDSGFDFDALVIDDSAVNAHGLSLRNRLERVVYLSDEAKIMAKYAFGIKIL